MRPRTFARVALLATLCALFTTACATAPRATVPRATTVGSQSPTPTRAAAIPPPAGQFTPTLGSGTAADPYRFAY